MTHRERVQAALAHETPDRCPLQISFTPEFADRLREALAVRGTEAHTAPVVGGERGVKAHNPHGGGNTYALERALDEDLLLTSVCWANSYYSAPGDYTDEWGVGWRSVEYRTRFGPGRYTEIAVHPLADDGAVAGYRAPDPQRDALYADAAAVLRDYRDDYWIVGAVPTTIFETAWALRGFDQLLMDFLVDPDLAHAILDIPFRYHTAAAERLARLGVDMIWLGDDVGTQRGMLLDPAQWRTFLKPRLAAIIAGITAENPACKVAYHSDGDVMAIVPELIEIGVDVLNPVQPACMDPAEVKRRFGQQLCFWGGIDEQHTLPFGTPQDVAAEARARIATLGRGGGYILAPTHHVQLDTPLENLFALVEEVTGGRVMG